MHFFIQTSVGMHRDEKLFMLLIILFARRSVRVVNTTKEDALIFISIIRIVTVGMHILARE